MMPLVKHLLVAFALVFVSASPCDAADWPQWLGPTRDGKSIEKGDLVATWTDAGPPVRWSRAIGSGFSSFAIVKKTGYTMATVGSDVAVVAFDVATGEERWQSPIGAAYMEPSGGDGPRATPTVDGNHIVALTPKGILVALKRKTGKLVWKRDLQAEFGGKVPEWGYSASPLVYRGRVYLEVGGKDGHGLMAFSLTDGEVVWKQGNHEVSYASPVLLTLHGAPQVLFYTAARAVGTAPEDGRVLWEAPWRIRYGLHIATPLHVPPNSVFLAAGYGVGGTLFDIKDKGKGKKQEVTLRWTSRKMRNRLASSVLVGGHLYGFDEERFTAMNVETGATTWQQEGFGRGSLIAAGDQLVVLGGDCRLVIVRADPAAYTPLRPPAKVLDSERCWTLPALANGVAYVRDLNTMKALQLRPR